jgi:hypothetical protein
MVDLRLLLLERHVNERLGPQSVIERLHPSIRRYASQRPSGRRHRRSGIGTAFFMRITAGASGMVCVMVALVGQRFCPMLVVPPNEMQIGCRRSWSCLHRSTLPLLGLEEPHARRELRPTSACRLHFRVRPQLATQARYSIGMSLASTCAFSNRGHPRPGDSTTIPLVSQAA